MSAGFDPESFAGLARVEEASFWFEARNRLILWALDSHFPAAGRFLEVGCGTGFVLRAIHRARPELHVEGSELHEEGLAYARARLPGVRLHLLDARRSPFRDAFDVVGAFDVLEHIDEDGLVLEQLRLTVRPGGGVLLTVPQHRGLWGPADEYARHRRRYGRRELLAKLRLAGLEVERVTSFVTLPLPAMALSRLRDRRRRGHFEPAREHEARGAVRAGLTGALALERAAIARGVSFPAGGSLLVVARRPWERSSPALGSPRT